MAKQESITYDHPRTAFAGIKERLNLASCVFQRTTLSANGRYVHEVRLMGKREGWQANFVWIDNKRTINTRDLDYRRSAAESIEGARQRWHEGENPSKQLLEAVAAAKAKQAARELQRKAA